MQLDMHFYGVYALARAAGIKPKTARLIAYASQFVDDAIEDEAVILKEGKAVLPTMTSHKPLDYKNPLPETNGRYGFLSTFCLETRTKRVLFWKK